MAQIPAILRRLFISGPTSKSSPQATLVLDVTEAGWRLSKANRTTEQTIYAAPGEPDITTLSGLMSRMRRADRQRPFGIRVPLGICLQRVIGVPRDALADVAPIALLDMERKTPFQREDVFAATYLPEDAVRTGAFIDVHQIILKRNVIEALTRALEAAGIRIAFLDTWNADHTAPLPINLLAQAQPARPARNVAHWMLGVVAAVALSLAYEAVSARTSALGEADAQAAAALAEMRTLRQTIESGEGELARYAALFSRKASETSHLDVLNELTRRLPDNAWVQSLRIDGDTVDISGLAKSATELIALFDGHPIFSEAALVAPVTAEPGQDRERFALRLHLRRTDAPSPQAAGGAP